MTPPQPIMGVPVEACEAMRKDLAGIRTATEVEKQAFLAAVEAARRGGNHRAKEIERLTKEAAGWKRRLDAEMAERRELHDKLDEAMAERTQAVNRSVDLRRQTREVTAERDRLTEEAYEIHRLLVHIAGHSERERTSLDLIKSLCQPVPSFQARIATLEQQLAAGTAELRRYVEGAGFTWCEEETTVFNVTTALGLMRGQIDTQKDLLASSHAARQAAEASYQALAASLLAGELRDGLWYGSEDHPIYLAAQDICNECAVQTANKSFEKNGLALGFRPVAALVMKRLSAWLLTNPGASLLAELAAKDAALAEAKVVSDALRGSEQAWMAAAEELRAKLKEQETARELLTTEAARANNLLADIGHEIVARMRDKTVNGTRVDVVWGFFAWVDDTRAKLAEAEKAAVMAKETFDLEREARSDTRFSRREWWYT